MAEELTLGRSQDNDIVVANPFLSGTHAALTLLDLKDLRFRIRDLGSTNGTFKDGQKVQETEFVVGDDIRLGQYVLKPSDYLGSFIGGQEPAAKAAPARSGGGAGIGTRLLSVGIAAAVVAALWFIAGPEAGGVAEGAVRAGALVLLVLLLAQAMQGVLHNLQRASGEKRFHAEMFRKWQQDAEDRLASFKQNAAHEADAWQGFRKFEVARKVPECRDITSFYLKPHDGKPLPAFKAGQYLMFNLKIPGQERDTIRCYSLSDSFHEDYYRVSIKKAAPPRDKPEAPWGLSSSFFHEQVEEGSILDVKAPGGNFYLDVNQRSGVVLIAGGVGLTPMVSMLNTLTAMNSDRDIWFFYGVRNGDEVAMEEHLRKSAGLGDNIHMNFCFSNPKDDEQQGTHYDHAERVSVDLFKRLLPSNNYDFYMCGPPPMMNSVAEGLAAWGVPDANVHAEAFGPAAIKKDTKKDQVAPVGNDAKIRFAVTDKEIDWKAADNQSILHTARDAGVALNSACEAGKCGTCLVAIREGEVEYLEEPDFDPEEGSCLTCCSVPKGNLVLDA